MGAVDNTSLTRFFTLHFLLPFIISAVRGVHLFFLHIRGSRNPLGLIIHRDKVKFNPYLSVYSSYPYPAGVVFPFCLRHPTEDSQQIRGGNCFGGVFAIYYSIPFINNSLRKRKLFLPLNKSL